MSKRIATLVALLSVVLAVFAASAGATSYTYSPYRCPEFGGSGYSVNSGDSVTFRFGWGALKTTQLDQFLAVQSGVVTLKDPSGNTVYSDAWAVGDATGWGSYVVQPFVVGNATGTGWATYKYEPLGLLSNTTGSDITYSLTMDLRVRTAVNDGFGATGPGSWLKVTNCPIVVHSGA